MIMLNTNEITASLFYSQSKLDKCNISITKILIFNKQVAYTPV